MPEAFCECCHDGCDCGCSLTCPVHGQMATHVRVEEINSGLCRALENAEDQLESALAGESAALEDVARLTDERDDLSYRLCQAEESEERIETDRDAARARVAEVEGRLKQSTDDRFCWNCVDAEKPLSDEPCCNCKGYKRPHWRPE